MADEKKGEVVSFEQASEPHVHARKESKLQDMQKAFKAATAEKFKSARKQRRKNRKGKKKK